MGLQVVASCFQPLDFGYKADLAFARVGDVILPNQIELSYDNFRFKNRPCECHRLILGLSNVLGVNLQYKSTISSVKMVGKLSQRVRVIPTITLIAERELV